MFRQFHEIIFTISGMGSHFLETFSSNYIRVGSRYGISLDKIKASGAWQSPPRAILVAACNILKKLFHGA